MPWILCFTAGILALFGIIAWQNGHQKEGSLWEEYQNQRREELRLTGQVLTATAQLPDSSGNSSLESILAQRMASADPIDWTPQTRSQEWLRPVNQETSPLSPPLKLQFERSAILLDSLRASLSAPPEVPEIYPYPEEESTDASLALTTMDSLPVSREAIRVSAAPLIAHEQTIHQALLAQLSEAESGKAELRRRFQNGNWILLGNVCFWWILGAIFFHRQRVRPFRRFIKDLHAGETEPASELRLAQPIARQWSENQRSLDFAVQVAGAVGQGDFEFTVPSALKENRLGRALDEMGERLRQVNDADRIRKWTSEGLNQFGEILRGDREDLGELGHELISGLVEYLSANQGVIYILRKEDPDDVPRLESIAAYAWGFKQLVDEHFQLNEGPVGASVYANRVIYMTDLPDNYVRIKSGLGDAQPRNILIVPLRVNEEVIGAIEVASFRMIRDYEIKFVEELGRSIAATIHGVMGQSHTQELLRQSQELAEQLAVREKEVLNNMHALESAQTEMEQKQGELDGLLSSVNQAMAMMEIDPEGRVVRANAMMMELLGFSESELVGLEIDSWFTPGHRPEGFWAGLLAGQFFSGELKYQHRNGQEIWVQATFSPIPNPEGGIYKIVHLATDTTESKLAAIYHEGHYQAINQTAGTMELDPNGTILAVNDLYLKMLGYSEEELTGARHRVLLPEEELKGGIDNEIWFTIQAGESIEGQFRLLRKDGQEKWIRGSYSPVRDLNGRVERAVHIATDISGQKRMEMKIKEQLEQMASQEEELRQNMEEMQATHEEMERNQAEMNGILTSVDRAMSMVTYDLEGKVLSANNSFLEFMRCTESDLLGMDFRDLFSEEDREDGLPERLLRELLNGEHHTGDYRFGLQDGKSVWLHSTFNPVSDLRGNVVKILQFSTAASIELEAQLKAIQESNAMLMMDMEGNILEANKVIHMYLGFEGEQLEGRNIKELIPEGGQMGMTITQLLAHLADGNNLDGEFSLQTVTGESIWLRGSYHPIMDLSGVPVKSLLAGINVSEEKVMADRIGAQLTQMSRQRAELRKNLKELESTKAMVEERELEMRGQLDAINSTNGLVEFGMDGAIIEVNSLVVDLLGHEDASELLGTHYQELFLVSGRESLDFWDEVCGGQSISGDYRWKKKEGGEAWISATFTPVSDREGQPIKVLTLLTDISGRKEKEKEIMAANEKLNRTLSELTTTQDQLILSEKMASLGQLIASVAHEVNTPISAVKASVRNMARIYPDIVRGLPEVLAAADSETQSLFMQMVESSLNHNRSLTTKEERAIKKEIYDKLDEMGFENAYSISGRLVELRLLGELEPFLPIIEHENADELLDLAGKVAQLKTNLDNIETAAGKTSKIVFALKSYTHVQNVDRFVPTDLGESLDLILTVYENQLKYGVEVDKSFDDVPQVPVYPDELGQVWTNILHNAIQAMENKGRLSIELTREGEFAVVRISDTGPGIPPDIQERIFDPFFTTKAQGEGTGLGLDICRKIIEKHHGRIQVDSQPGRTTFSVYLPLEQPEELEPKANESIEAVAEEAEVVSSNA